MNTLVSRLLNISAVEIVKICFFLGAFTFLILVISRENWSSLHDIEIEFSLLFYALIPALVFRYVNALSWVYLLSRLAPLNLPSLVVLTDVYACAWMGRYIPGKAALIVGKVMFASQHGISKRRAGISSLYENILQLFVSIALSAIVLIIDGRALSLVSDYQSKVGVSSLLAASLASCSFILLWIRNADRLRDISLDPADLFSIGVLLKTIMLYILASTLSAFSYLLITMSLTNVESVNYIYIMSSFLFAGTIGTLAFFAPAGIGVREAIQTLLLTIIMPIEHALIVAVLARACSTFYDLLFFSGSRAWRILWEQRHN